MIKMDVCGRCGTKLQPNWKFCVVCGFDLLQNKGLEIGNNRNKHLNIIEKSDLKLSFNKIENDLNNLHSFSRSLGTLFGQIGGFSIFQIIASFILAFITVGMVFSTITEPSPSAIFSAFQGAVWTILIVSLILEVILYYFIIKLIKLLKWAEQQEIPYQDKYRKSAFFFMVGIIVGIILFVVGVILMNWILQQIQEVFNDPLFELEDLEQLPSTDIISALTQVGRIGLSLAGFYYLKQNFTQLSAFMRNGGKVFTGFQLLIIGYLISILGTLIGLIVDLASILGLVGLILTIVGYFQASNGLQNTIWSQF